MATTTYYFDGHTMSDFTDVSESGNLRDGNTSTVATFTSDSALAIVSGTTAPGSGSEIHSVRIRYHNGTSWSSYEDLTEPAEGFSWSYLRDTLASDLSYGSGSIEGYVYDGDDLDPFETFVSGSALNTASRIEIEVTHEDTPEPPTSNTGAFFAFF